MPLKVYKFCFSPCARFVELTARMLKIPDVEFVEVDLSKGEQLTARFLEVNPKHQVPAIDEDGAYMAESRDICKHLFDKYNTDPDLEHWYPKDPEKRKEVDEWMDWSKSLHLDIEMGVVGAHVASQPGSPWRRNYGSIIAFMGRVARNKGSISRSLKANLDQAEEIVGKNNKHCVKDLNLGDLATFEEVSMAMECHPDYNWSDYPNLSKLHVLIQSVPEFSAVHGPFLDFIEPILKDRVDRRTVTASERWSEFVASFGTIGKLVKTVKPQRGPIAASSLNN